MGDKSLNILIHKLKITTVKKTIGTTCIIVVFLFMTTVAFSQSGSDYKARIESLNKEMAKNMMEGNYEKLLGSYTEDAISMPSYQPLMEGLATIKKANDEMVKSGFKCTSFVPKTLKVIPNGNLITEIGTYKMSFSMPNMNNQVEDQGKYLTIWEKQKDGSLKVKVETWNSDVDPMTLMGHEGQQGTAK